MTAIEGSGLFLDRLTGRQAGAPTATMLVGQWMLAENARGAFMNSVAAARGDFVMPDREGRWQVVTTDGVAHGGTVARSLSPDDLEAESVQAIGARLGAMVDDGATWLDWIGVAPLVPGISEQIDVRPLERQLREHFGHLRAVCERPRAHLHVEVERVPVSRARRIPPAAVSYLASHTEDWDRPLLRGVLPKRVNSEVRHDQIDIYENRVAARLLDNLNAYLSRRIQALQRYLRMFEAKEDFSSAISGTYQRGRRISELWGESLESGEGRAKVAATLRELESLKYRLMGLHGSPLYEEVPRRAFVATTLKTTNILSNDQHYRRVADLWRAWARTGAGRTVGTKELYAQAQALSCGLDRFAMLLVVRALDMLGFEPTEAMLTEWLCPGTTLRIRGGGVALALAWRLDGSIQLAVDDRELNIVALASNLAAGSDERIEVTLEQLRLALGEREGGPTVVLYLASGDRQASAAQVLHESLYTVGNDPEHALAGGGCLPVSPWDIGSTERVARALRWFLTSARFLEYPFSVRVPQNAWGRVDFADHADWLRVELDEALALTRPPRDFEWDRLDPDSIVKAAQADRDRAFVEHERLSAELREAARQGKTGSLGRMKHEAHEKVLRCENALEASRSLAAALQDRCERAHALLACPTCGHRADPVRDFRALDRDCFRVDCSGCGTRWGTQLCSNGHRYPVLLPSGRFSESADESPGWHDRVYGCDLLAVPARRDEGGWGFVCPHCGEVS